MKDLLEYIIKNLTGSEDFKILEETEEGFTRFVVRANPEIIGLIIGKEGKTIKTIRNVVKIKATLEKKGVSIFVEEA